MGYQNLIKINHNKYLLKNSKLEKLNSSFNYKNYLLTLNEKKYYLTIRNNSLQLTRNEKLGTLIHNSFLTLTGGIIYYDFRNNSKTPHKTKRIYFQKNNYDLSFYGEELTELDIESRKANNTIQKSGEIIEKAKREIEVTQWVINGLMQSLLKTEKENRASQKIE